MMIKRSVITGILIFGAIVFGFVMLLRGCLAKFDERSAISPVLHFEKQGREVVFSIVKFEKTTNYSQKSGMTTRTVSTAYHIQTNDAVTGQKLESVKVKKQRQIKQYPVEIMGQTRDRAWVFIGEPMAFDAFTLEKKADLNILEGLNPQMNGLFPAERRYYRFDQETQSIIITGTDGTTWKMDASTLKAVPADDADAETDPVKREKDRLNNLKRDIVEQLDTLYQQKNRGAVERFYRKEISPAIYEQLTKAYYKERDVLYQKRDSIAKLENIASRMESKLRDLQRTLENLHNHASSFSSTKFNADTINGTWYALFAADETKDVTNDYFYYRSLNKETARRQFSFAPFKSIDKDGDRIKIGAVQKGNDYFLDGGFLLSKATARPLRIGEDFLVVHKDRVGNEGTIIVSLVSPAGKIKWNCNTALKAWEGWIETKSRLIITGTDNKKLSSSEINVLLIVDLATGRAIKHDYFTDK